MIAGLIYTPNLTIECIGEKMKECDELTDGGFWLIDAKTKDLYMSDKFLSAFGYDRCDFLKPNFDTLFEFVIKKDLDIGIKDLEYVLKTKSQETFMNDIRYNCKNGTIQKVSCSGTVFFIKDEPVLILGTHKLI